MLEKGKGLPRRRERMGFTMWTVQSLLISCIKFWIELGMEKNAIICTSLCSPLYILACDL